MKYKVCLSLIIIAVMFFCVNSALCKDFILPAGTDNPLLISDEHVYFWDEIQHNSCILKNFNFERQQNVWQKDFDACFAKESSVLLNLEDNKLFVFYFKNNLEGDYSKAQYEAIVLNAEDARVLNSKTITLPSLIAWDSFVFDTNNKTVNFISIPQDNKIEEYSFDYKSGEFKCIFEKEFDHYVNTNITKLSNYYLQLYNNNQHYTNENEYLTIELTDCKTGNSQTLNTNFPERNVRFYNFLELNKNQILILGPEPSTVGIFNIEENTLTTISPKLGLKEYISRYSAIALDSEHILFTGGLMNDKKTKTMIVYNIKSKEYKKLRTNLKHARYDHKTKFYNTKEILVYGGSTTNPVSEYDFSPIGIYNTLKSAIGPLPFAETIQIDKILK